MSGKRFSNVWDAIESDPAAAENLKLRSGLMMALADHIEREGVSQAQAAKLFGVSFSTYRRLELMPTLPKKYALAFQTVKANLPG